MFRRYGVIDDHGSASAVEPLAELAQAYAAAREQARAMVRRRRSSCCSRRCWPAATSCSKASPGTAKTLLAKTLAALVGRRASGACSSRRT